MLASTRTTSSCVCSCRCLGSLLAQASCYRCCCWAEQVQESAPGVTICAGLPELLPGSSRCFQTWEHTCAQCTVGRMLH